MASHWIGERCQMSVTIITPNVQDCINGLGDGIRWMWIKYVDDTKLHRIDRHNVLH